MKQLTLVIVIDGDMVLLGMKKRGFGAGRYNGFGGKVEGGETVGEAATRELGEEVGIKPTELTPVGQLEFSFLDGSSDLLVHLFVTHTYTGEVIETDEMKPEWFSVDVIPYEMMWPDDIYWLPSILTGMVCRGRFVFDRPSTAEYTSVIIESDLVTAKSLSELALPK